jgi:DNA-binding NtrC family response regulator
MKLQITHEAVNKKVIIVEDEFIVGDDLRLTLEKEGNEVVGIASSVEDARKLVAIHKPGMALLDIHLKGKLTGIDFAHELREQGIPFIFLSAYSNRTILEAAKATQPYGFLVKPFRDKDVLVALDIARYRHVNSLESSLHREQLLINELHIIHSEATAPVEKLMKMIGALQLHVPFDYLAIGKRSSDEQPYEGISYLRIGMDEYQMIGVKELIAITGIKPEVLKKIQENTFVEKKSAFYNKEDFQKLRLSNPIKDFISGVFSLTSNLVMSFSDLQGKQCYLSFYGRKPENYKTEHLALLGRLYTWLVNISEYISCDENIIKTVNRKSSDFKEIVGNDFVLLNVLDQAQQVAPFDTSVLIQGETGTGKEKIAFYIHKYSSRYQKPFIKINCAVLPPTLVESELFGHEKGSFTGATERRVGKFEQADGGTIFLDEIGELSIDIQAKLLRVLQEHEIERIGGKSVIKIDVRIIAATNKVLENEIAEGRFRMDLYYRISVFPLLLPPLRERKNDIELLAVYFAQNISRKINKPFHGISSSMMAALKEYDWPGNIRELENVIEQSVVLNNGPSPLELKRPLNPMNSSNRTDFHHPQNLDDIKRIQTETEKNYILSVLRKSKGKIRGTGGAAEVLSLPASTLESKISKLGIKKEDYLR